MGVASRRRSCACPRPFIAPPCSRTWTSKPRCISLRELIEPGRAFVLTHPPSEGVDIDTGLGRGLWCWLRRRLHLEACGRWCSGRRLANLALGRRASRVANRRQESPVRELKTRGREIVDAWDSYQADRDRADEAVGLPELNRTAPLIAAPVLASILTAGACLSVASWAGAGALVADPVMAAIERHQRPHDACITVWSQTPVLALHDRRRRSPVRGPSSNTWPSWEQGGPAAIATTCRHCCARRFWSAQGRKSDDRKSPSSNRYRRARACRRGPPAGDR